MSDPAAIPTVREILADELAHVTPAMVEAGSAAAEKASTYIDGRGKRQPRMTSEAQLMAAIWRAMLAAKIGEPGRPAPVARRAPVVPDIGDRG